MIDARASHRVGIVGAGPVGLALAARLASLGIRSTVVEKSPHLLKKGSKACLIQGDVLEILDKIGCADRIAEEGIPWRVAHTYIRDVEMITQAFPERPGFSQFVNISQYRIEQELLQHVEATGLVEILWSHELIAIEQTSDEVTADLIYMDQKSRRTFDYLVACDGVHSRIREMTGLDFQGYTHPDRFLITDIKANIPRTKERHFFFDSKFNPGRQLVMHPQPDNVWRIDWQLSPETNIEEERFNGQLDRRIRRVIGDIPYRIEWISTYRFNQKVVEQFKHGRVFFAGDAAHSLPPYGSRGMNSGIQDADNLAWKLAAVFNGWSPSSLLETYHDERYPAALENLRVTEATMRFMIPDTTFKRVRRRLLFRLAVPFRALRKYVDHGKMAEPYLYKSSPIISMTNGVTLVGQFAPDGRIELGGKKTRLRKLFGSQFVCLFFGNPEEAANFYEEVGASIDENKLTFIAASPKDKEAAVTHPAFQTATYDDIHFYKRYYDDVPVWYLIRPDGHIAAQHRISDAASFCKIFAKCMAAEPKASYLAKPNATIN